MPRTADPAKKINTLTAENKTLKTELTQLKKSCKTAENTWKSKLAEAVELAYNKGYEQARIDQGKLDDAFDKFMDKAARQFEKEYLAKLKKTTKKPAKRGRKPAAAKATPAKKASKADAPAKRRGRPAKKAAA